MKTNFDLLKNGNVAKTVWANEETKEIYPANSNSFGWNALLDRSDNFYKKYGVNLKISWTKSVHSLPCYSANEMKRVGFKLVCRGDNPLW
jgi:hypothetical protein